MDGHFQCSICGEWHEGPQTDWAYTLPDEVWDIPEAERAQKARFDSDLCQFGERYFIRSMLDVPLNETGGRLGWGVWAEVQWPVFERYLEFYNKDGSVEPPSPAALANRLAPYDAPLGAALLIQFRGSTERPALFLPPGDASRLAAEQRGGVDNRRLHDIIDIMHGRHPSLRAAAAADRGGRFWDLAAWVRRLRR